MSNLLTTLDKMQDVLASMSTLLEEEQQQLSAGNINSNLLQRITENKGALLSTLNYLDEMRRTAAQSLATSAPYRGQSDMASRWQRIQQHTLACRMPTCIMVCCCNSRFVTPRMRSRIRPRLFMARMG